MSIEQQESFELATSSPEEALDFACSLLTGGLVAESDANPGAAQELLASLAHYIQLRYVGELGLALEELSQLGQRCKNISFQREQFRTQLRWVAETIGLSEKEIAQLHLLEK